MNMVGHSVASIRDITRNRDDIIGRDIEIIQNGRTLRGPITDVKVVKGIKEDEFMVAVDWMAARSKTSDGATSWRMESRRPMRYISAVKMTKVWSDNEGAIRIVVLAGSPSPWKGVALPRSEGNLEKPTN